MPSSRDGLCRISALLRDNAGCAWTRLDEQSEASVGIKYALYVIDCIVIICTKDDHIALPRTPVQNS
jgi:hypothetical protein